MNVVWGTNVIPNNMTGTKVFQALSKLILDVKIASTQKKMFASNATSYIVATMNINISQHVIIVEICFAKNTWKNLANMDGIAKIMLNVTFRTDTLAGTIKFNLEYFHHMFNIADTLLYSSM
jgi:hypothetical protein